MSQPPIDPSPEQHGGSEPPEAPKASEGAPESPQFAPPQSPATPGAPAGPGAPQEPSYAPQPPHFAPPEQPQQPQFAPPQFAPPQAPAHPQYGQPTQPRYGDPAGAQQSYNQPGAQQQRQPGASPQYGQPSAPQPPYGQPGVAPQYGQPAAPQYGQPAAPQYGQPAAPPPPYGQPAYAAAPAYGMQAQFPPAPQGTVPGPGGPFDGAVDPDDLTRPLYGATFMQATKRFFKQYANFSGRASRSEFWWVMLLTTLLEIVPFALYIGGLVLVATSSNSYDSYNSSPSGLGLFMLFTGLGLLIIIALGLLLPSIAVAWRRLHDGNFAGPMYFLSFIPYAGSIVLLVFMLLPPKAEGRRFDEVNR